jgi:hypothetical protein
LPERDRLERERLPDPELERLPELEPDREPEPERELPLEVSAFAESSLSAFRSVRRMTMRSGSTVTSTWRWPAQCSA